MAHYILIHGAFHGGWCWERVTPLLEAAGHTVQAPDLPGMGADTTPFTARALDQWTAFVADLVLDAGQPVTLVGHSQGGAVISQVGERVPKALARLVFITALLMPDGETLLRGRDLETLEENSHDMLSVSGDGTMMAVNPQMARAAFYNMMSEADRDAAAARLTPQPLSLMKTPLALTPARFGSVPRAYIEAEHDMALTLDFQREMQANWPCDPVITLPCDHSPFYSTPDMLAKALAGLA